MHYTIAMVIQSTQKHKIWCIGCADGIQENITFSSKGCNCKI